MAFKQANFAAVAIFNSSASFELSEMYEKFVSDMIANSKNEPSHQTFSPSSFRCKRKQWFRLRGSEPDAILNPDKTLDFTASIGTARHKVIQSNLKMLFKDNWIEVEDYMSKHCKNHTYTLTKSDDGLETLVEFTNIPVRFAVDGILFFKGKYYLLEIKTCSTGAFVELTSPKGEHINQVHCYSALLDLDDVFMIYEDRTYGNRKYYELHIPQYDKDVILSTMTEIIELANNNLAPNRLPKGDYMCNNCEYKKKCKEWG